MRVMPSSIYNQEANDTVIVEHTADSPIVGVNPSAPLTPSYNNIWQLTLLPLQPRLGQQEPLPPPGADAHLTLGQETNYPRSLQGNKDGGPTRAPRAQWRGRELQKRSPRWPVSTMLLISNYPNRLFQDHHFLWEYVHTNSLHHVVVVNLNFILPHRYIVKYK